MNQTQIPKLLPVLRRPRSARQIPLYETDAMRAEREAEELRLKAFTEGTTPYGREIFRRTLYLASKGLKEHKEMFAVTKEVDEEIAVFTELRPEFVLLLARIWNQDPGEFQQLSTWGLATHIVMYARLQNKANEEAASHPAATESKADCGPAAAEG